MKTVLSATLSLRCREIRGDDARYYNELFPAVTPLTQEREDTLVGQALSGCRDAEDALTRQYARIAISTALRYRKIYKEVDLDSLVSAALFGVLEGIRHFDVNRGTRLSTCVWYWVLCYVKRERLNHQFVKRGPTTYVTDFNLWDSGDQTAYALDQVSVESELEGREEKEKVHRLMEKILNSREFEVLNRRHTSCVEDVPTLTQIGKDLEVTRQRVGQIKDKAIEKLKRAVGASACT